MDLSSILVLHSSWEPGDHIEELDHILQDCSTQYLENRLTKYMVENIEPIGWKAIWRSPGTLDKLPKDLQTSIDFIIEVKDVSHDFLEAKVSICDLRFNSPNSTFNPNEILEKEFIVPLIELHPLAKQDNEAIDVESTTEVIEQIRFIYKNIWLPWDSHMEQCLYTRNLIEARMKTYKDIEAGIIPPAISMKMRNIVKKASEVHKQIFELESRSGIAFEEEVDQTDVVQLMKLNSEMERFEAEYDSLKDPTLREFVDHKRQIERRTMLNSVCSEANVLVVCSNTSVEAFESAIMGLEDFVKTLPSAPQELHVQTFPSLQLALDSAKIGDVIVLVSGSYRFTDLGLISKGGTICCKSGVAEIRHDGSSDVIFDLSVEEGQKFLLKSVILHSLPRQIAILIHQGNLSLMDCSFKGSGTALSLLNKSRCLLFNCSFSQLETSAILCGVSTYLEVTNTSVSQCQTAFVLSERAKVKVTDLLKIEDCVVGFRQAVPMDLQYGHSLKEVFENKENITFINVKQEFNDEV